MRKFIAVALVATLGCANITCAEEAKMQKTQEVVKAGSLGGFKGDSKIFSGEVSVKTLLKAIIIVLLVEGKLPFLLAQGQRGIRTLQGKR